MEDDEWDVIFQTVDGLIMTTAFLCERLIASGALQRDEVLPGLEDIAARAQERSSFRAAVPRKLADGLREILEELNRQPNPGTNSTMQ